MPNQLASTLGQLFQRKNRPVPPLPITTYYLTGHSSSTSPSTSSTSPALAAVSYPHHPRSLPPSSLLFSLTHPDPATSDATRFFLTCLPDPIGFAHHAAQFARARLILGDNNNNNGQGQSPVQVVVWRHQLIALVLEDSPGLAATSGGKIVVSLHWVGDIMRQVQKGERDLASATREFKGVVLHELVHTIQHDGNGTTPGWLIESIADHVRLAAHLDPPHWRKPGQGKRDKGWEDAYDAGARFLEWLTAAPATPVSASRPSYSVPTPTNGLTPARAPPPMPTQYPLSPPPPVPPRPAPAPTKPRRGPYPEFVKVLDTRLAQEQWEDTWWEEMTGASLEVLWREYLDYYV